MDDPILTKVNFFHFSFYSSDKVLQNSEKVIYVTYLTQRYCFSQFV